MKLINTEDAVGQVLCHDITQIVKGVTKDAVFRKGHIVRKEDIPVLLSVGKEHLYVWEKDENMLHEDEAAKILYEMAAGSSQYICPSEVKEGKIELIAKVPGLFKVDSFLLKKINSLGEMMIASRHGNTAVREGDKLVGTRIIPLVIEKEKMERARAMCAGRSVFEIIPFKQKKYALITTGNEVYKGRIEDTFSDVIISKLSGYDAECIYHEVCPDDHKVITASIRAAISMGAEMVICTGGMSVDPDDRTPLAIKNAGVDIVTYGAPVLPGAMLLLSYTRNRVPVIGLPGCVMYAKRTVFDLILPRLMADDMISADSIAALGEGGLCLGCDVCTYPNCGFGK